MENLVSVCIPAYNNAPYIMQTVDAILNQTYKNIELIIVDDNSKDNTYDVIKGINDPRVKIYRNEKNLGMSGNWNRCLQLCTGKYIKLICADDILMNNSLEKEVAALENNPTAVLSESDTRLIDLSGKQKGTYKRYPKQGLVDGKEIARAGFFKRDYFGAPLNNTFRRETAEKVGGFDPWYTYILDYDFWISLACEGDVYIIHETLNGFRIRKDSNTGQVMGDDKEKSKKYLAEHRHLVEKFKDRLNLSDADVDKSVKIRKRWSFMVSVYQKIFVHK